MEVSFDADISTLGGYDTVRVFVEGEIPFYD